MKEWLGNILAVTFSLVLTLVAVEVGFRVFIKLMPAKKLDVLLERPKTYFANSKAVENQDYQYTFDKPEGVFRIAGIGDSFTFPTRMQIDDTFLKRLERFLNLNTGYRELNKAEVLNFSKMGLSTWDEIPLIKYSLKFKPNVVLLEITLNDLQRGKFEVQAKKHPNKYVFGDYRDIVKNSFILSHWKSLAFLMERIHNSKTMSSLVDYYNEPVKNQKLLDQHKEALKQIRDIVTESGAKFGAVIFPLFYTPLDEKTYPFKDLTEAIKKSLTELKVPYLDLKDRYIGIPSDRLHVVLTKDTHPNEIGHRIAAESIYEWLTGLGWIPEELKVKRQSSKMTQNTPWSRER